MKLRNLTGINDEYEEPDEYDLKIQTDMESKEESAERFTAFIKKEIFNLKK
jgi:adenylylsulfate kinase-like enzyme